MICPKCKGPMWDNRKDKKGPKSPDFKCKEDNGSCKWQLKKNGWEPSDFPTAIWEPPQSPQKPMSEEFTKNVIPAISDENGARTGCAAHCVSRIIASTLVNNPNLRIQDTSADDIAKEIAKWELAMEKSKDYLPPDLE